MQQMLCHRPDQAVPSSQELSGRGVAAVSVWGLSLCIPGAGGPGEGQGEGWQHRDGLGRADKPPAHPHHLSPDVSAVLTSVPAPGALDVTAAQDGSGEEPAEGVTHQTSHLLPHSPGSTLELHPQP